MSVAEVPQNQDPAKPRNVFSKANYAELYTRTAQGRPYSIQERLAELVRLTLCCTFG